MTRMIEWDGEPFALLVQSEEHGDYLVPPVLLDSEERLITREGREVAEAVVFSGQTVELPVIEDADAATVAEVDQRMARISEELGVPIGPPEND